MTRELKGSGDGTPENGSPSPNVLKVILAFRMWGWIGVWAQLVLGVISGIILLLASARGATSVSTVGSNVVNNPGTIPGLSFAWIGLAFVGASIFWSFRYTQIAKKLRLPERPTKAQTVSLLKIGIVISLVGALITLIGAFVIVGSLTAKSLTPQSANNFLSITVQPIDMLVVQANTNTILAHFASLVTSLWLLNRITDKANDR
jgi:hypothetical protein